MTWDLSINTWEQQIDLTFPVLLQVSGAIWIALFLTKKHACKEAPTTDVALDWAEESLNVSALFHHVADVWEIMCVHAFSALFTLLMDMVGGGMTV